MINATSRHASLARFRGLLSAGPLLVLAFILESLIAKGSFPGLRIGFILHMLLTGGFLGLMAIAGEMWPLRSPERTWQISWQRTRHLRFWLAALVSWGFFSCLFQKTFFEANLVYCALWGLNYFVAFRSVPRLVSGLSVDNRVDMLAGVLVFGVVGTLLHPHSIQGRLAGVFGNPSWSGSFFGVSVIIFTILMLVRPRRRFFWGGLLIVVTVLLFMTRTRGGILGAFVGLASVAWLLLPSGASRTKQLASKLAVLAVLFVTLFAGGLYVSGKMDDAVPRVAVYLRVPHGIESLREARSMNQSQGYHNFLRSGPFGNGLVSKYGDKSSARTIMGIEIPQYDWTTDDDPLNAFLLINQQLGMPGFLFFVAALFSLMAVIQRMPLEIRLYCAGMFVFGLFMSVVSGSWFLSFGDSFERYSLVWFGMLLFAPITSKPAAATASL